MYNIAKKRALLFGCGSLRSGFSPWRQSVNFTIASGCRWGCLREGARLCLRVIGMSPCVFSGTEALKAKRPRACRAWVRQAPSRDRWWMSGAGLSVRWHEWFEGRSHCLAAEPIGGGQLRWRPASGENPWAAAGADVEAAPALLKRGAGKAGLPD